MATSIGEAFITLRPDLKNFANEAQSAVSGAVQGIERGVTPSLQKLSSSFGTLGRLSTVAITAPIVAIGAVAIKSSVDFESAFAGVRKTVDATEPEFAALRDSIRNMAKEMPASAVSIAGVAEAAGQLGIKKENILEFTKTMIQLGATTNLSAEQAATAMAQLANVMQLPQEDIGRLASVLVDLGNNGASTESQILDMATNIAGAAKVVGISAQDVLGFANAIASVGIEAEAGGSAISRVFVTLAQAVGSLAPSAEQLDAIADAQHKVRDASDAVEASQRGLVNAFQGVSDAQRGLRNAYEGVGDAQRGVRDATEGVAAAHRTASRATESLSDAQKNLTRAYRDQRQASLDARRETLSVAEAQQGLREVLAGAGSQMLDVREAQRALTEAQRAGSKEIADAEFRLAQARRGGKGDTDAVRSAERALQEARSKDHTLDIAQAQQRLNQVVAQGPRYQLDLANAQLRVEESTIRLGRAKEGQADKELQAQRGVRDATQGVKDARLGERDANERLDGSLRGLRNAIEGVGSAQLAQVKAIQAVGDAQKAQVRASEDLAEAQAKLSKLNDPEKLKKIAEVAGLTSDAFADMFKSDPSKATVKFVEGLDRIKKSGGDVFKVLDDLGLSDIRITRTLLGLSGAGDLLALSIERDRQAFADNSALQVEYAKRLDTTAAQFQIFMNNANDLAITLGDALVPIMKDLAENLQPVFDAIKFGVDIFKDLPKPVQTAIVSFVGAMVLLGPALMVIGGATTGIVAIGTLVGFLIAATPAIVAFTLAAAPWLLAIGAIALGGYLIYKNWDKISALFEQAKEAILGAGEGVLNFFENNWPEVATLISGPFAPIVALATDAFGIRSALEDAIGGLIDWLGGVPGWIKNAFGDAAHLLWDVGKAILNGLWEGMKSAWEGAKNWLKSLAPQIPRLKGPPEKDAKLLEPAGQLVMTGFATGLKNGWQGAVAPTLLDFTDHMAAAFVGVQPSFGTQGLSPVESFGGTIGNLVPAGLKPIGGGLTALTGSGGGGGSSGQLAPVATKDINVNFYGTVNGVTGAKAVARNIGFGVQSDLNRRGIYT